LREWFEGLEAKTGLPLEKTLLAGFSQGGAMTLDVGFEYPLAGLVAMSGYLHAEPQLSSPIPPVCVMHGNRDPVVPLSAARSTRDILKQKGVAVQYQEFDMAHEVCPLEIEQLREFAIGAIAS
jgi:phospholipase/carboxylesterase